VRDYPSPIEVLAQADVTDRDLRTFVADEKAGAIERQRPAIRSLGAARLRALVLAILDALTDGSFNERKLAGQFGISLSTMSRFAGSRWQPDSRAQPPDLYVNLAHLLASDPVLTECAQDAGVFPTVAQVRQNVPTPRLRGAT